MFTSVEQIDVSASLRVKRPEGLEPYNKEKLMFSLHESLKHLEGASEAAKELTETITLLVAQNNTQNAGTAVVPVKEIVSSANTVLLRFDNVAGLHYQASHKG